MLDFEELRGYLVWQGFLTRSQLLASPHYSMDLHSKNNNQDLDIKQCIIFVHCELIIAQWLIFTYLLSICNVLYFFTWSSHITNNAHTSYLIFMSQNFGIISIEFQNAHH